MEYACMACASKSFIQGEESVGGKGHEGSLKVIKHSTDFVVAQKTLS